MRSLQWNALFPVKYMCVCVFVLYVCACVRTILYSSVPILLKSLIPTRSLTARHKRFQISAPGRVLHLSMYLVVRGPVNSSL